MPKTAKRKSRLLVVFMIIPILIFSLQTFGQSTNTSLSGTVQDTSEGYLPGVTITATNVDTGVETTTLTNSTGAFSFPSLQSGMYQISAELEGFQKSTRTDVDLTGTAQSRLNFELKVAGFDEEIEVTTTAQDILTESSSSTGTVLRSADVIDLPLTSNDVMELVNIMGGVAPIEGSEIFARETQEFAGVSASGVRVQQDGITLNDVRWQTGIASQSRINTEMVSEFKLILSPVDAEMGRGTGQVQILTKSGANAYHGSGVWNITNSALDANSWSNNRSNIPLDWRNLNTYTLTVSGPIVKNKTFFFVSWDHAIPRTRDNMTPTVLTNCARKGIFRYFNGWMGGHYDSSLVLTGITPRRPVVDVNGIPLDEQFADQLEGLDGDRVQIITTAPNGTDPSSLQYVSVFGPLTDTARAQVEQDLINCSNYDPYDGNYDMSNPLSAESMSALGISRYYEGDGSSGDPIWRVLDTQAIPGFTNYMPEANSWRDGSDGLNYATHRWTYSQHGVDNRYGQGEENARKNISFKIDHNFNDRHRISGNYTYERDVNPTMAKIWPNGFEGTVERTPQRFSFSVTSSLKPTLLNEARFGVNRNLSHAFNALDSTATKDEITALMNSMVDTTNFVNFPAGEPLVFNPQGFGTNFPFSFWNGNLYVPNQSHFIGGRHMNFWGSHSFLPSMGGWDNRWQISDTLTWTKGRHSFKFGGEMLMTRSHQDADGDIGTLSRFSMPSAFGGVVQWSRPDDLTTTANREAIPGLVGNQSFFAFGTSDRNASSGTLRGVQDLRDYMSGSLAFIWQWFFINDPSQREWNDINKGEITRILDIRQKEMSFFAKDDWKVSNSLTLNLGLRYEYYGLPWLDNGLTLGLEGGANALFGVTGRDFSTWMAEDPTNLGPEYYTQQQFIGPNSQQPDIGAFDKDVNNFGPAVGFAWQLPWFGKGKTTVRGGYQLSYSQIASAANTNGGFSDVLAGSTGTNFEYYYSGDQDQHPYMRIADIDDYLPTIQYLQDDENPILPLATLHIENRTSTLSVYDPDIVNPYTQSLNLSVSRNIGSHVTLDVRYIGTLGRKRVGSLNLNESNWLYNGLKEALDAARMGGESVLLDRMFEGTVWNDTDLGSLNRVEVGTPGGPTGADIIRATYQTPLSEGDYNNIAGQLDDLNYQTRWNPGLPSLGSLEKGSVLRHANTLYPGEFPENFISANPQLATANWYTNLSHNNYHSMQVRFNVRPTHNFSMTGTYTWSKNLGDGNYTNPKDRANTFDYTVNGRSHQFNSYGSWTLPFGANGFFFRDISNPIVRRVIEGWDLSWILRLSSGSYSNLSADATHLYGNSVPNVVRPDLFDGQGGHITWEPGAFNGWYFGSDSGDRYMYGPDLQCFDGNLVQATFNTVQVDENVYINELDEANSLRDECITNMSALYFPMTEMVTVWVQPEAGDPDYDDRNSFGYVQREEEQDVYSPENVIFQHPLPGEYGNYGRNKIEGPGTFSLDMAMGKTFQLTEGKSIGFRMDAGNILNHPSPGGGGTSISQGSNPLGYIGSKSGNRKFQAKITIRF